MNLPVPVREPGGHYILDEQGKPVIERDVMVWSAWFAKFDNTICVQVIGDVTVSTIFLGMDHNFFGVGDPILYETMIFGGDHDGYQRRYATQQEAMDGHVEAVAMARGSR